MTDLERRALLGDRKSQEECTRKNILLPCPCCKGKADLWRSSEKSYIECLGCGLRIENYNDLSVISDWNTRAAPPIEPIIPYNTTVDLEDLPIVKDLRSELKSYKDLGVTPEQISLLIKFFKERTSSDYIASDMNLIAGALRYEKLHEQLLLTQQKLLEAIDSISGICKTYERVFHD